MSIYNTVEYPGFAYPWTHPDRLATIAALYGLAYPPVARCRVLEIGCGDGGNLMPMAVGLSESRFVGIDLAEKAIAAGQRVIDELGLPNIELHAADLMAVDASWGEFDYIVTHGLYAWVPEAVREQILRVSKQNLSPNGIAYISYNALPGCRIREMLREMMLFHVGETTAPGERIAQAQALLGFVATARSQPNAFRLGVEREIEGMKGKAGWSLFHDEIGENYAPMYFHQFMEAAGRHGLQFVGEANFPDLSERRLTPEGIIELDQMAGDNRILREQYADFANGRHFRKTLLCHAGRKVDASPHPDRLRGLYASSTARQLAPDEYVVGEETRMKTNHPGALAMMAALVAAAPQVVSVEDLGADPEILLSATLSGLTELHTGPHPLVAVSGEHPTASTLARYQAEHGLPVATLHHRTVQLEDLEGRKLLARLDGTVSLKELVGTDHALDAVTQFARLGLLMS